MTKHNSPWIRARGLERVLAQETNISDFIQYLSDLDPNPWISIVGFLPNEVIRESLKSNNADLQLSDGKSIAIIEVKLGHLMSESQQVKYEAIPEQPDLYLLALAMDESRVFNHSARWKFRNLSEFFERWLDSDVDLARTQAQEIVAILKSWDDQLLSVSKPRSSPNHEPLSIVTQKFLGRVLTRRVADNLHKSGFHAYAGVTLGGGLPIVQAWTPIRGHGIERAFIAEVRWWGSKPGGELRFGVDFGPSGGGVETEELRREAYNLALKMDEDIKYVSFNNYLLDTAPDLANILSRDKPSRPPHKGDWEQVVAHGFTGALLENGSKNNRRRTTPGFFGDGALRFQAIIDIDFQRATADDLETLIETALRYLTSREP